MTAIQTMKKELNKIQQAQNAILSDYGHVPSCHRYRYQLLVEKARMFHESIQWMEEQIYAK